MTDTKNPKKYERIEWTDVRDGDVLLHENGDRLTVSAVDFDGYQTCKSTAGSWHSVSTLRGSGFTPHRKQPELPNEQGAYLDKDGDYWLLDRSGNWYDWSLLDEPDVRGGRAEHYAPFTRLVPLPTREQIRETLFKTDPGTIYGVDAVVDGMKSLLGGDDE